MHTTAPPLGPEEEAAVMAAANLAERAGAKGFRIGYTSTTPATWYAVAEYGGQAEIGVRGHPNPAAAATALAKRLLTGAKCKCGGLVALSVSGAWAPGESATMLDGSDPSLLRDAPQCLWILEGSRWSPGCDAPPIKLNAIDPASWPPPTGG